MHIVKFQGGLANQLFQLCLYNKLIERYGKDSVCVDISHYKTNNDHGGFKLNKYFQLNYINELPEVYTVIYEMNFDTVATSDGRDYYYNGYWQSEVFFPGDISFIYDIFKEKKLNEDKENLVKLIETSHSVSVHVRRGDYVNNPFHGNIANMAYIKNAIEYIEEHISHPVFFVFSDDISWCRENVSINEAECHYVTSDNGDATTDLFMMSLCKNNIIANSSFSWWAQRLNKNENKVVIAPEYWFNEGGNYFVPDQKRFVYVKNIPHVLKLHEDPIFSIIVNFRNNELYLRRFFASLLNQKFERIELLVIDNPSDNIHKTLMDYVSYNAKIHVIELRGMFCDLRGLMTAWEKAKGRYVFLADEKECLSEECWTDIYCNLNSSQRDISTKWLFDSDDHNYKRYAVLFKTERALGRLKESICIMRTKIRHKLRQ